MPRSLWSGSISFGLVNVPIKLFAAVSPKDIRFHLLHDADGVRIKQKRVCPVDGEEVSSDHLIKGYEISPNKYVTIQPSELDALDPKAARTIDITAFIDGQEIDPIYFEHPYHLVPDKGASKAYSLLLQAMQETGKVALARMVMRTKQYWVAVRPSGKALTMSTLFYQDEIVPAEKLEGLPDKVVAAPRELEMAKQLVNSLAAKFHPEEYKDEYRQRVLELVERKAEGQEIVEQPAPPEAPKVVNLMEALEASLAAAKRNQEARAPASTSTKKRRMA